MPVIFPDHYALAAEKAEKARKSVAKPSKGVGDEVSLAEPALRFAYAFVEEVDALPVTMDAATSSDLDAFPEEPAPAGYRVVFKLDCIEADHARKVAKSHTFEKLDHQNLTREAVKRRKAVLKDLLKAEAMYSVSVQIRSIETGYMAFHGALPINTWVLLSHLPPGDGEPQSLAKVLADNAGRLTAIRCPDPVSGQGVEVQSVGVGPLRQVERDWLYEVVSFNHIPDIGTPEPPSGIEPPPVPIFPLDDLRRDLESDPSIGKQIGYSTAEGVTEEFRFKAPGYWVHSGTNILSRDHAQCWVDKDGNGYRLYADNVARPGTIVFLKLDKNDFSKEMPPQAAISNPILDQQVRTAWQEAGVEPWTTYRPFQQKDVPRLIHVLSG